MSNFNLDYNKMDFISVLEILQKLWLSKNVVKIDWFPHGKIFHWKSFKPANRNVCLEIVRRPLNEARYENWPIWNWKKSYRLLVKFIWVFTCSEMIWNSYRLFWPIWNSTPDMSRSADIYSTGLRMKTWKMIIASFKISFVDCSKVCF